MSSTELTVDERDIRFILNDWLRVAELRRFECFEEFDQNALRQLMEEQKKVNAYLRKTGAKRLF